MKNLIWVGNKLSDIADCFQLFNKSINLYGKTNQDSICFQKFRCNNNIENPEVDSFIRETLLDEISKNNTKIMFYNPRKAYKFGGEIERNTICLNDCFILELLSDKITCHEFLRNEVNFAPFITLYGKYVSFNYLKKIFPSFNKFVIQSSKGSGGFETFVLTQENELRLEQLINANIRYLISGYIENNVSFNVHVIIGDSDYIIFPSSKQLIQLYNSQLIYRGADFINMDFLNNFNTSEILSAAIIKLQKLGYRGIIGFDMILDWKTSCIYLAEINSRFQGSSFILNKELKQKNLPTLQELNMLAFEHVALKDLIPFDLSIPYSSVMYYQDIDTPLSIDNSTLVTRDDDNLKDYAIRERYSYAYKKIYIKII